MSRKSLIITVIFIVAIGMLSHGVLAHSDLVKSTPAPGDTVDDELDEVRLEFNARVKDASITLLPQCDECKVLELDVEQPEANIVVGKVSGGLKQAPYNVLWAVKSDDNHELSGTYSFIYDGPDTSFNRYLIIIPALVIIGIISFVVTLYVIKVSRKPETYNAPPL